MLSISINSQDMDGYPSTVDGCSLMRRELGEGFWWANVVMLRDIFVKLDWMNPKWYKKDLREMCPPLYRHPQPSCSNLLDYVVGQRLARVKVPCDRKVGSRPCLSSPLFMFELRSQLWINSVSSIIDYWSSCSSPPLLIISMELFAWKFGQLGPNLTKSNKQLSMLIWPEI